VFVLHSSRKHLVTAARLINPGGPRRCRGCRTGWTLGSKADPAIAEWSIRSNRGVDLAASWCWRTGMTTLFFHASVPWVWGLGIADPTGQGP